MKLALLIALLLAALALLGVSLFSGQGPDLGMLKLEVLELRQENRELARRVQEMQTLTEGLSDQIAFLESGPGSHDTPKGSPVSPEEFAAAASKMGNTDASAALGSRQPVMPPEPALSAPTPAQMQWIGSAVAEVQRQQAETQRTRVLEAQIAFVRSKLEDVSQKVQMQGLQKDQTAQVLENYLRQRSEIRGSRGWWEYSTEEWEAMRGQLKDAEKSRHEQIAQILTPEQLKEFKQWEKKRPGWFQPGNNFNPRGGDF